jgi:heptosyltransferase-2
MSKVYGKDLQVRFWPGVRVIPFPAPWTAFKGKYRLHRWPWRSLARLLKEIRVERFDVGLSARWDPRDHLLIALAGARKRLGYPRLGSGVFLTHPLQRPDPSAHRSEYWRVLGNALRLNIPERVTVPAVRASPHRNEIIIHSGAGQPVRVWPLERYLALATRLRKAGQPVQVVCDPDQRDWWLQAGEEGVTTPYTVTELLTLLDWAYLLIGNDSGPGHIAALAGIPTFTVFGPQLPEWFAPSHPAAEWIEGKPCPYKPCSDYCRWPKPRCLTELTEDEVWERVARFIAARRGSA